jgi:hypothetical protein
MFRRPSLSALTLTTIAGSGYYVYRRLLSLEARYPALAVAAATPPPGHAAHDKLLLGARIPRSHLLRPSSNDKPSHEWARRFLSTRMLSLEARLLSPLSLAPPDRGEGGFRAGQKLLNGLFTVEAATSARVLVLWHMSGHVVRFFETIARWGYPWRMMSGGCHEWDVVELGKEMVEVRFGCVHFYRELDGDEKRIPEWVGRLHRGYARVLMDEAVKEMERQAASSRVSKEMM